MKFFNSVLQSPLTRFAFNIERIVFNRPELFYNLKFDFYIQFIEFVWINLYIITLCIQKISITKSSLKFMAVKFREN